MNDLKLFSWICLRLPIQWKTVLLSCDTFKNLFGEKISEDELFDEIDQLKNYLTLEKLSQRLEKNISTEER